MAGRLTPAFRGTSVLVTGWAQGTSGQAAYVTGIVLPVDGGVSM